MGEVERLGIVKFQRSRKIDREIIAQLILRERGAITIGDLTARSGDIENICAREFLCLECGNNLLVNCGRRRFWRRRGAGRYRRCRSHLLPGCVGERKEHRCHTKHHRETSHPVRFCAWSRMTSPSAFAKIGARPPPALAQFHLSPQFLPHWPAAIVLPTRTFAATRSCDAD